MSKVALAQGSGGQAYFVTDDEVTTFRQFLTTLLKTQHITPPDRSIPGWLARALGAIVEGVWKLFGLKSAPPLTRFAAALMSRDCTIRIDKARRELSYEPVMTVERGMRELAGG